MNAAIQVLLIGTIATAMMDMWLQVLKRLNIPTMNFALVGRWVAHLCRGQLMHEAIGKSPNVKHELLLGWLTHYAIGVSFAGILVVISGRQWMYAPTLLPALATGVATVIAPLFVMQPAMGSGIASSRTPTPIFNTVKSVINHAIFGVGLYLAAVAIEVMPFGL